MKSREWLFVLRPLGLGDFLTGVPAYRALARHFPTHHRVLGAPAALHPLVDLLPGVFHACADVAPLEPLAKELDNPDVAVDLHGKGPASHRILLAAHPTHLIAFANWEVPESLRGARWFEGEHEVTRWCRMLAHNGISTDADELDLARPRSEAPLILRGATVVHAGAASAARRWPAARFVDIVRACTARGEHVVLTGGAGERTLCEEIAAQAELEAQFNLAGRTSLLELCAVVATARRVICGDTGTAHLATAYRVPSVILFGPVSPHEWGPPPGRSYHRSLWAGQRGNPHGAVPDPGLASISVRDVLAEIDHLRNSRTTALPARPTSDVEAAASPSNAG